MVYLIESADGPVKIGYTERDPEKRLRALQTGSPAELRLVAVGPGDRDLEAAIQRRFRHRRLSGEWFDLTPEEYVQARKMVGSVPRRHREMKIAIWAAVILIAIGAALSYPWAVALVAAVAAILGLLWLAWRRR